MSAPKVGDYRVWWIPQVPGKAFEVSVADAAEGKKICDILAAYDRFQFDENIKPNYFNTGGVQMYEDVGDECDWFDVEDEDEEW